MIAQRAYTNPPFRRGLADFMEATEERGGAYDRLLGVVTRYDRETVLPAIFGDWPVGRLKAPTFPDDPVKLAIETIATCTIIAGLLEAKKRCNEFLPRSPEFYHDLIQHIDRAITGERRIRSEQMAKQRFSDDS